MPKRWKKQKAGQQQQKQRKSQGGASGGGSSDNARGTMGWFRGGMKKMAGTGEKKKGPKGTVERAIDLALWVAVAMAGIYFFSRQCR